MTNPGKRIEKLQVFLPDEMLLCILPDEMLLCILNLLDDVRDVARCRCVCKRWKDLTYTLQSNHILPMVLIKQTAVISNYSRKRTQYSTEICIDKWWQTKTLIHELGINSYQNPKQYCSQNGFILNQIRLEFWSVCIVRNPITRQEVKLVFHEEPVIFGIYLHPIRKEEYCTLWRVKVGDYYVQYKMVNLGSRSSNQLSNCNYNCWRNIGNLWSHRWVEDTTTICLDGFMYWMVQCKSDHFRIENFIIAFDIKTEEFTEITFPSNNNTKTKAYPHTNLLNADGYLSIVNVYVDNVITIMIWTMKDPKTRFWTASQYVLSLIHRPWYFTGPPDTPKAIAIVNSELIIQGEVGDERELFVCNLKSGTIVRKNINDFSCDTKFWAHHPSIASLTNCQPVIHIPPEE